MSIKNCILLHIELDKKGFTFFKIFIRISEVSVIEDFDLLKKFYFHQMKKDGSVKCSSHGYEITHNQFFQVYLLIRQCHIERRKFVCAIYKIANSQRHSFNIQSRIFE